MNFGILTQDLAIPPKRFAAVTFIVSGALAWFFILNIYLVRILASMASDSFWITTGQILFFGTGIISAILGSFVSKKVNRRNFLLTWTTFGVISTAFPYFFQGIVFSLISSTLLGVSLGLGLPSSLTLLADCTAVEERGRVAGTSILISFILAFMAMAVVTIMDSALLAILLLGIIVRSTSFIALFLEKCDIKKSKDESGSTKPDYKALASYLFPWIIFVIAGVIATNLIPSTPVFQSANSIGTVFRYAFIAIFGFIWGVVADRFGRRWPIIIGLVILGISFGILGFFPMEPNTVIFYLALSGVAWGAFLTIYLIIPGDLAISGYAEKFYALGTISPLIIMFSLMLLLSAANVPFSSSYSQILSIMLFLSITPVLRAKETLHESKIRERRLKEHTEKVAKLIEDSKEGK